MNSAIRAPGHIRPAATYAHLSPGAGTTPDVLVTAAGKRGPVRLPARQDARSTRSGHHQRVRLPARP
jgi:hypothetical protein